MESPDLLRVQPNTPAQGAQQRLALSDTSDQPGRQQVGDHDRGAAPVSQRAVDVHRAVPDHLAQPGDGFPQLVLRRGGGVQHWQGVVVRDLTECPRRAELGGQVEDSDPQRPSGFAGEQETPEEQIRRRLSEGRFLAGEPAPAPAQRA